MKRANVILLGLALLLSSSTVARAGTLTLTEPADGDGAKWTVKADGLDIIKKNGETQEHLFVQYKSSADLAQGIQWVILYNDADQKNASDVVRISSLGGTPFASVSVFSDGSGGFADRLQEALDNNPTKITETQGPVQVGTIKTFADGKVQDTIFVDSGVEGVPEPATFTLLGIGIACMAGYGWRRRRLIVA
jgi:hypothetical protein